MQILLSANLGAQMIAVTAVFIIHVAKSLRAWIFCSSVTYDGIPSKKLVHFNASFGRLKNLRSLDYRVSRDSELLKE
jgi:hypothetical protein